MPPPRGAFIVIEGLDRSGKSTQASLLHDRLQTNSSTSVKLLKFPDRSTPIGKLIDSYLRSETDMDDHTVHLLFSANRWELASHITTLLHSGTTIICDRYAFSGIAFSASKTSSRGPLLSYEWCRGPDISLPAPDLTLFLDISPEKAAKEREGYGEERYEKLEMQVRVREVFGRIGTEMGGDKWIKVDADRPREDVAQSVWEAVEHLKAGTEKSIGKLWERML